MIDLRALLEQIDQVSSFLIGNGDVSEIAAQRLRKIASVIDAALDEKTPEPMAFIVERSDGSKDLRWDDPAEWRARNLSVIPLYAAPPPAIPELPSLYRCYPQDLYDFMGWLTTRKERLALSATAAAAPAAEAVGEYLRLHPEIEQGVPASPSEARAARYRKTMKLINDIRAVCTAENLTKFVGLIDERLAAIEREGGA